MIDHCTDPAHATTTITEGDYLRCGDCGRRLREGDPRNPELPLTRGTPGAGDIYDATTPPGIQQLPAVTTNMTPEQFKAWVHADGTLFMVILPANRTFIIKVPDAHHEFFVAMMQQVRFALGPEVQAVRMNVVSGDPAAADGTATEAPDWAKPHADHEPPPNTDLLCPHHIPRGDCTTCSPHRPTPPEKHEYIARPTAEQENPDHVLELEKREYDTGGFGYTGECSCGHWHLDADGIGYIQRRHTAHVQLTTPVRDDPQA